MWLLASDPDAPRKEVEEMSEASQKEVIIKAYKHLGLSLSQARIKADQFALTSFAPHQFQDSSNLVRH
jgi:hypothetical protein